MSAQVLQHRHIDREALKTELLFVDDPRVMDFVEGFHTGIVDGLIILIPLNLDGSVNQDIQRMLTAWGSSVRASSFQQALDTVLAMFNDETYFQVVTFTP